MTKKSTQKKILNAARNLFILKGFEGTSINDIAQEVGMSKSLIFHHFGTKENLWMIIKQSIVSESNDHKKTLPSIELPFKLFLTNLFVNSIHFYQTNPDVVRMINWQRLDIENKKNIGIRNSPEMEEWINAFEHYKNQGDINQLVKIEYAVSMILAIISSTALDPNVFIKGKKNKSDYIDFCVNGLLKAFK